MTLGDGLVDADAHRDWLPSVLAAFRGNRALHHPAQLFDEIPRHHRPPAFRERLPRRETNHRARRCRRLRRRLRRRLGVVSSSSPSLSTFKRLRVGRRAPRLKHGDSSREDVSLSSTPSVRSPDVDGSNRRATTVRDARLIRRALHTTIAPPRRSDTSTPSDAFPAEAAFLSSAFLSSAFLSSAFLSSTTPAASRASSLAFGGVAREYPRTASGARVTR